MTGVDKIPSGGVVGLEQPMLPVAGAPMLVDQALEPSSLRATTSPPTVGMKNSPPPPGASRYRGEAATFAPFVTVEVKVAAVLKAVSAAIIATADFVNFGCTKRPSRDGFLFRSST